MAGVLLETLTDSAKLIPFLFITYLAMGILEHVTSERSKNLIAKADKVGPVWGSVIGIFPQCGFSAAASYFYIGRVITLGTLISVYMATSDEMIPILVSAQASPSTIGRILIAKVVIGMLSGFIAELLFGWMVRHKKVPESFDAKSRDERCSCGAGILVEAIIHTAKVFVFIFLISLILGTAVHLLGRGALLGVFFQIPIIGKVFAAIVGLIPNCASSVVITQLYLDGIIGSGTMMSGLLVSAGVGLLVLFKENRRLKENIWITALLFGMSVAWGCVIDVLGIVF